jgi:uncharacterized membrane protein
MELDHQPTSPSRPVLPWAAVFLAAVLALQVLQARQAREPGPERTTVARSAALRGTPSLQAP